MRNDMNFHFQQKPTNHLLLEQLKQIDKDLDFKKQQLLKKQTEQKKLEAQFYEDPNKLELADQIMKELLNNKPDKPLYSKQPNNSIRNEQLQLNNEHNNIKRQQVYKSIEQKHLPNRAVSPSKRDLQKLKLQQNYAKFQYPFENKEEKLKQHQNSQSPPQNVKYQNNNNYRIPPQSDHSKQSKQIKYQNPFIKNDNAEQLRKEQQTQYRRQLQRQAQLDKQKKQQEKKYLKQYKYQFNSYVPQQTYQPSQPLKKKIDPNGKPPEINFTQNKQIYQSDKHFMKLKIEQIRGRYKKGRIDYEQYQRQIKKIQNYYGCSYQEEQKIQEPEIKCMDQPVITLNQQYKYHSFASNQQQYRQPQQQQFAYFNQKPHSIHNNNNPSISQKVQNSHIQSQYNKQNSSKASYDNQESLINLTKQFSEMQKQMMIKFIEQMRSMYQTSLQNNNKFMQQAMMTRMQQIPYMPYYPPNMMHTQQVYPNNIPNFNIQSNKQHQSLIQQQYSRQSNQKNHKNEQKIPDNHRFIADDSASSYIQKSLSGIVNKIPLTKQQLKNDDPSDLKKFYQKKYQIYNFKPFDYTQNINQSTKQISSVSNSLTLKNGQQLLRKSFQHDLQLFKKMQIDRQLEQMRQKLNTKSNARINKQQKNQQKYKPQINNKFKKKQNSYFNEEISAIDYKSNNPSQFRSHKFFQKQLQPSPYKFQQEEDKLKVHHLEEQFQQYGNNKRFMNILERQKTTPIKQDLFLKKHISHSNLQSQQKQQPHKYNQQTENIKNLDSPIRNKNEILQQDQYQTQPKYNNQSPKKLIPRKDLKFNDSSKKLMNVIMANNEALNRYSGSASIQTLISNQQQTSNKQYSAVNYNNERQSYAGISPAKVQQYVQSSLQTVRSEQQSQSIRKNNLGIFINNSNQNLSGSNDIQTVQSVQQSSIKLNIYRPPMMKKARSTSRKKQTSLVISNMAKQKVSCLIKPPQIQTSIQQLQSPKFDSNIYESGHEQTIGFKFQSMKSSQQQMPIFPKYSLHPKLKTQTQQQQLPKIKQKQPISTPSIGSKWKSLQQARNMAKQCRQKVDDTNRSSAQEKLSQLQSFITNKRQQSILRKDKQENVRVNTPKKQQKKDILKILDDLEDQEIYQDDFNSYEGSRTQN